LKIEKNEKGIENKRIKKNPTNWASNPHSAQPHFSTARPNLSQPRAPTGGPALSVARAITPPSPSHWISGPRGQPFPSSACLPGCLALFSPPCGLLVGPTPPGRRLRESGGPRRTPRAPSSSERPGIHHANLAVRCSLSLRSGHCYPGIYMPNPGTDCYPSLDPSCS
jgi:hypothetical protein